MGNAGARKDSEARRVAQLRIHSRQQSRNVDLIKLAVGQQLPLLAKLLGEIGFVLVVNKMPPSVSG